MWRGKRGEGIEARDSASEIVEETPGSSVSTSLGVDVLDESVFGSWRLVIEGSGSIGREELDCRVSLYAVSSCDGPVGAVVCIELANQDVFLVFKVLCELLPGRLERLAVSAPRRIEGHKGILA